MDTNLQARAPTKRVKDTQFMLRIPASLHELMRNEAERTFVSMNSLINYRLVRSYESQPAPRAIAEYRLGLLRSKPTLTPDEQIELTYILATWKELQS